MLFYFSGTGNSKYAAQQIAKENELALFDIADELKKKDNPFTYLTADNEAVGFVFPVYAWGPPKMVVDFIDKMKLEGGKKRYFFAVCTCGSEVGLSVDILKKRLAKNNLPLHCAFSIVMPNNYIIAFDIDPKEVVEETLVKADLRLNQISEAVFKKQEIFDVKKGGGAALKSRLIHSLFTHFAKNSKKFTVTGNCTGCGLCEKICPAENIKLSDGRPVWGNHCQQCLACIHRCPVLAIEYGRVTENKGRYVNPNCKWE